MQPKIIVLLSLAALLIEETLAKGACGKNCAMCSKSAEGDHFCVLCYKKAIVATNLTNSRCEGNAPSGCAYTHRAGKKSTCTQCEIGKVMTMASLLSTEFTCEDPQEGYDCAMDTKMSMGGLKATVCTGCPNGKTLRSDSGKCVKTSAGKSIKHCQSSLMGMCFKCQGNIFHATSGSSSKNGAAALDNLKTCPDPSKDCLNEKDGACLLCNVEGGKGAIGVTANMSQIC